MAATGDYVWKPRTVEDSVDAGVHPAVAAMRLNGGVQPQLNLNKLGIDPSRPDWGSNKSGTALVDQLGFLRVTKPDTPAWAMAEEGLAPKSKKQKKEKKKKQKDKKKEKRKKKEKKSKGKQSSSSSSSNGSSSSSSSGSKSKAKKAKKKKKRKEEAVAPAGEDGTAAEGEASKQRKTATEAAAEPSEAAPTPVPEAAPTTSADASPFPSVLAALERHDLSSLDEAVGLLTPGADHPDPQRAAIAGALGGLLKASVDPTGINRIAVARAGAIPQLIQLLRSSFAECQLQAAFALHNLTSKNADNKEAVVMENGVSPLLAVLRSGTQEARAQVVGVLRNLSGGSLTCKAAVETAGVVPTIVAMLTKASMHHQQVQANLAVVLYNLCKDSADCRLQVVRAGALPVLVSLLGGGIPQVQQEAADTLRIVVADNDDYCAAAISAGIAPVLGVATGPMAAPKLRQQAGLLKKELAKSGGPEIQKALK